MKLCVNVNTLYSIEQLHMEGILAIKCALLPLVSHNPVCGSCGFSDSRCW